MNKELANIHAALSEVFEGIQSLRKGLDEQAEAIEHFIKLLLHAPKIYAYGAGRSGLISAKPFVMRLRHLGLEAYSVGDVEVPGLTEGDLLVVMSTSGTSAVPLLIAEQGKALGAKLALITGNRHAPLAKGVDVVIEIKGQAQTQKKFLLLNSLLEQLSLIFLDAVTVELKNRLEVTEDQLRKRHANLDI
jgi:6-phospho-3-hexuloisomerase